MSDLIDAHIAHLKAASCTPLTIYGRTRLLHRLDEDLPRGLDSPRRAELEAWFAQWTGWTLYSYWEGAYVFYAWASAGRDPYIEWNPMEDLTRPKTPRHEPRPASDEQITTALARLPEPWRLGVLIATLQGLRCAEICRLDREQVDRDTLWVDRKGGTTQLLPTHELVWAALAAAPPGPIVRTRAGNRFRPAHYSGAASEALTAAGLPDVTLHRFRASFATRLAEDGVHARVIQDLMGHAQLTTTQGYIRVKEAQRRLAVNSLRLPASHLQAAA
jgi:integrase